MSIDFETLPTNTDVFIDCEKHISKIIEKQLLILRHYGGKAVYIVIIEMENACYLF